MHNGAKHWLISWTIRVTIGTRHYLSDSSRSRLRQGGIVAGSSWGNFGIFRPGRALPLLIAAAVLGASIVASCTGTAHPTPGASYQGWSSQQQDDWYRATQGSRLMPLAWLRALEQAGDPAAFKARPLDGIWATAPYLHNGSVANLYELLLPPARRHKTFRVGTRVYDPTLVGYSTRDDAPGNAFTYDIALPGNANIGHDYGAATLTADQRQALLAYLKTL